MSSLGRLLHPQKYKKYVYTYENDDGWLVSCWCSKRKDVHNKYLHLNSRTQNETREWSESGYYLIFTPPPLYFSCSCCCCCWWFFRDKMTMPHWRSPGSTAQTWRCACRRRAGWPRRTRCPTRWCPPRSSDRYPLWPAHGETRRDGRRRQVDANKYKWSLGVIIASVAVLLWSGGYYGDRKN